MIHLTVAVAIAIDVAIAIGDDIIRDHGFHVRKVGLKEFPQ